MTWQAPTSHDDYDTVNGIHLPPDTITVLPTPKLYGPLQLRKVNWSDDLSGIEQGRGDGCSLVAATIAIQGHCQRYGCTTVRCSTFDGSSVVQCWFVNGTWRTIRVDDISLGIFDGNDRLDCSSHGASCWATAAERVHFVLGQSPADNLNALIGQQSNPAAIMHHLSGWLAETIDWSKAALAVFDGIIDGHCIACIGTSADVPEGGQLLPNHAYAVVGCYRQFDKTWVLLRNPWSDACCDAGNTPRTLWVEAGSHESLKYLHIAWNLPADDELVLCPGDSHRHKIRPLGIGTVKVFLVRHYTDRRQLLEQHISMKLGSTSTTYTTAECFSASSDVPQIDEGVDLVVRGHPESQPLQRYRVSVLNGKFVQS